MSEKKKVSSDHSIVLDSYQVPPLTVPRRENSNMIQISTTTNSIWRGNLWPSLKCKITLDKHFLSKKKGTFSPYILAASIQDAETGQLCKVTKDRFQFKFESNSIDNETQATITTNPYNNVDVSIHQDVFNDGQSFYLLLEALHRDGSSPSTPIIFGRSQLISVTNYALTIEQRFAQNQYVSRVHEFEFAWYSKCGGENAGLDVVVSMKDDKGQIIYSPEPLHLVTELVYSDESPTPFMPLCPLKERRTSTTSRKTLYRALRPEPVLGPDKTIAPFCFRIEEVSFHHPNHSGFKLKVSCPSNCPRVVHPGILRENIIVLSKPKHENTPSLVNKGIIQDGGKTPSVVNFQNDGPIAVIPVEKLINGLLTNDNKCRSCSKIISKTEFLSLASHEESCHIVINLLPFINHASKDVKSLLRSSAPGRKGRKIRTSIKNSNFQTPSLASQTTTIVDTNISSIKPHKIRFPDSVKSVKAPIVECNETNNPYTKAMQMPTSLKEGKITQRKYEHINSEQATTLITDKPDVENSSTSSFKIGLVTNKKKRKASSDFFDVSPIRYQRPSKVLSMNTTYSDEKGTQWTSNIEGMQDITLASTPSSLATCGGSTSSLSLHFIQTPKSTTSTDGIEPISYPSSNFESALPELCFSRKSIDGSANLEPPASYDEFSAEAFHGISEMIFDELLEVHSKVA